MSKNRTRNSWLTVLAVVVSAAVGCGSGAEGYRVSGTVTFKGRPVPAGKIYFMPDGAKGNTGATGFADIKDGKYDTSLAGGQAAPPGAVTIAVEGTDPNSAPSGKDTSGEVTAKLLFARYELAADIPKSTSTKDIHVPAEAAKGPVAPKVKPNIVP